MKLRLKVFLALACLLPALPAPAGRAQAQGAITEEKAVAVLAALDKAARAGKVEDIAPLFADEVQFKVIVEAAGMRHEIEMDREKFISETRSGFAKRIAYEGKRHKTQVTISKDGQRAMVTSELFEKMTRREGTLSAISSEVYVLRLRGGKIVVTSYDATMRVLL